MALVDDVKANNTVLHPNQARIINSVAYAQRLIQSQLMSKTLAQGAVKGKITGSV